MRGVAGAGRRGGGRVPTPGIPGMSGGIGMDVGPELAVVVWHARDHRIELTYLDHEPDQLYAAEGVAAALAARAGLRPLTTSDGTQRWVRKAS